MDPDVFLCMMLMSNQRNQNSQNLSKIKSEIKKNKIINKEEIERRTNIFEKAKVSIKKEFYGIDEVIDRIFDQIKTWYIYPEYTTKPTIINLWGLTGVGKTDFIKKLRMFLEIEEFCDIETDSNADSVRDLNYRFSSSSGNNNSVLESICKAGIDTNDRSIILFDEIHRFRTLDEKGRLIPKTKYSDIWKFLSDGSLVDESLVIQILNQEINSLENRYNNIQVNLSDGAKTFEEKISYMAGMPVTKSKEEREKEEKLKEKLLMEQGWIPPELRKKMTSELDDFNKEAHNSASLNYITSFIDIDEDDIDKIYNLQIMYMGIESTILNEIFTDNNKNENKIVKFLRRCSSRVILEWLKYKRDKIITNKNKMSLSDLRMEELKYVYSKALVFICGNIPKDLYDNKSGKIEKEDILKFLGTLFNPEQVSRFGNNYIIYPILDEKVYDKIIEKEIILMQEKLRKDFETDKINFDVDKIKEEVHKNLPKNYIYNGVRPVYSEIQRTLSNIIPNMIIEITKDKVE